MNPGIMGNLKKGGISSIPPIDLGERGGGGQECASKVSGARCFGDFSEISVIFFQNACGLERQTSK